MAEGAAFSRPSHLSAYVRHADMRNSCQNARRDPRRRLVRALQRAAALARTQGGGSVAPARDRPVSFSLTACVLLKFETLTRLRRLLRFYLATDERNATALACFRSEGAVFASVLLTAADRRELAGSWSLVFTDVVAVLEQEVLARSGTFYGHAMSSFVGASVDLVDVGNGDGPRLTGPALCPLPQAASSIDALHSARTAGRPSWTEKDRAIPSPFAMPCVCLVVVEHAARPRLSAIVCPPERELSTLSICRCRCRHLAREREREGELGRVGCVALASMLRPRWGARPSGHLRPPPGANGCARLSPGPTGSRSPASCTTTTISFLSAMTSTSTIQLRNLASRATTSAGDDPEGGPSVLRVASREGEGERDPLLLQPKIQSDQALETVRQRAGKGMKGRNGRNRKLAAFYEGQNEVRTVSFRPACRRPTRAQLLLPRSLSLTRPTVADVRLTRPCARPSSTSTTCSSRWLYTRPRLGRRRTLLPSRSRSRYAPPSSATAC